MGGTDCKCATTPAGPIARDLLAQAELDTTELGEARSAAATEPFATAFPVPEYPSADWFERPDWVEGWRRDHGLGPSRDEGGILRLTVTDEGRIGGWFYEAGQCIVHMQDACPGPSPTRYAAFHQQDVILDDGQAIRVGAIGNTNGHASPWVDWKEAQRHYADPDAQMIVCRAGDDERGGWIAGCVVPGSTYGDIALLRRSGLSGDWRPMPPSWWRAHAVSAAAVRDAEGYDCLGPTLVTRPALPLVKSFAASLGRLERRGMDQPWHQRPVILGGAAGVQLDGDGARRAWNPDQSRDDDGKFGEGGGGGGEKSQGEGGGKAPKSPTTQDWDKMNTKQRMAYGTRDQAGADLLNLTTNLTIDKSTFEIAQPEMRDRIAKKWEALDVDISKPLPELTGGDPNAKTYDEIISERATHDVSDFEEEELFSRKPRGATTAAAGDTLASRCRALSQELATGQNRLKVKPGSLMSPLLSAAALLERGNTSRAATKLASAVKIARTMEDKTPALGGLTDRVQALADEAAGGVSTDGVRVSSTLFESQEGPMSRTRVELPDGTVVVSDQPVSRTAAPGDKPADGPPMDGAPIDHPCVDPDGTGICTDCGAPCAAHMAAAEMAPATAAPPDDVVTEDVVAQVTEGDAGTSMQDQINDLNTRLAAVEEFLNSQLAAQVASLVASEIPMPLLPVS